MRFQPREEEQQQQQELVLPVGGPSRSLLEVRGAPWVALPALICSFEEAGGSRVLAAWNGSNRRVLCLIVETVV